MGVKLILPSGRTKEFSFSVDDNAAYITQYVYDHWPAEWADEPVNTEKNILRLIYQGRFLHGNVTLAALQLPVGKSTVMHLVARENLPEPNSHSMKKEKIGGRTCVCCVIL